MVIDVASGKWDDETKYNRDKRTINNNIKAMERQLQVIEEDQLKQTISGQLQELKILIQNDNSESNKQDIKEKRDEFRTVANARKILENISPSEINSSNELCTFAVQTLLRTKGYFNDLQQGDIIAKDRVDAINGIETKKAINNFQTQHNLTPTGKIDDATIQKLLEETIDHGQYFDDPEKRNQVNTYINELQSYTFDQVVYATDNTYKNKLFAIKNYTRTKLQEYEKSNAQHASLIDNINRIDDYLDIGDKYSQIVNKIKEADKKYGFDQNWDTLKTTIEPGKMKAYRDEINAIKNINPNSYSTLSTADKNELQNVKNDLNTQLHQKEKEYEAFREGQINQNQLIQNLLKDADAIKKAISNYDNKNKKIKDPDDYHFKNRENKKAPILSEILRDTKRPKIKKGKEEYTYKTSGNYTTEIQNKLPQYKAIIEEIEKGKSGAEIKNNLNTLLYQEIAEEPAESVSVTSHTTKQKTRAESMNEKNVISQSEFQTLCGKNHISEEEWQKIIEYATQKQLELLVLGCDSIPPIDLLQNKHIGIYMTNKACELNSTNIEQINQITSVLSFANLNINTDLSSLQCSYLSINHLSTNNREYLKGFQGELYIRPDHGTINSDLSYFQCKKISLGKLSNNERKYVKGFQKELSLDIDNFSSLPDLSEVQCSDLELRLPNDFDINKIPNKALQNLSKYNRNLGIYKYSDGGYQNLTEEIKTKIQALQNN